MEKIDYENDNYILGYFNTVRLYIRLNDGSPYVFLHEYIHYLQTISTVYGIVQYATKKELLTQMIAKYLLKEDIDRSLSKTVSDAFQSLYTSYEKFFRHTSQKYNAITSSILKNDESLKISSMDINEIDKVESVEPSVIPVLFGNLKTPAIVSAIVYFNLKEYNTVMFLM